jgi:hypothetical protein
MIKFVVMPNNSLNYNIIKMDMVKEQKDGKDVWVINEAAYMRQPAPPTPPGTKPSWYGSNHRNAPYVDIPYGVPPRAYPNRKLGLEDSICFDSKSDAMLGSEAVMREHIRARIDAQRKEIERIEEDIERLKQLKPKHYLKNMLLK